VTTIAAAVAGCFLLIRVLLTRVLLIRVLLIRVLLIRVLMIRAARREKALHCRVLSLATSRESGSKRESRAKPQTPQTVAVSSSMSHCERRPTIQTPSV
jgi:hypothetical protein